MKESTSCFITLFNVDQTKKLSTVLALEAAEAQPIGTFYYNYNNCNNDNDNNIYSILMREKRFKEISNNVDQLVII